MGQLLVYASQFINRLKPFLNELFNQKNVGINMLPNDGSVLIIDDQIEEGLPLMNLFSFNSIPFMYQNGEIPYPSSPFKGIRMVFLDFVLGTDGQSDKTKISKIIFVLEKLINANNGPYFIIAWTQHDELIPQLKQSLNDSKLKDCLPLEILNLEKSTYMETNDDGKRVFKQNAFQGINENLTEKLKQLGGFQLILLWHKLIKVASIGTTGTFDQFMSANNDNWNKNISTIFYELAKASAGQKVSKTDSSLLSKEAFFTLMSVFDDVFENEVSKTDFSKINFEIAEESSSEEIMANLNSKLLISGNTSANHPGNIYEDKETFSIELLLDDSQGFLETAQLFAEKNGKSIPTTIKQANEIKKGAKKEYQQFKDEIKKQMLKEIRPIVLDFSAQCDYAQNKIIVHKLIGGFIASEDNARLISNNSIYVYKTPNFLHEKKIYQMIFNMKFITGLPFMNVSNLAPLYMIRSQLLFDIQTKIVNYINRPGIIAIQ